MILHYTSGSTGKPKGVLHVHNAMIQHYQTGKWVLDLQEDDIYWCTADPGWVTGTSYGIWAPWLNGVTNVIRGGRFSPDDWYFTLEKYRVTVWYSAPTAFRMLMGAGDGLIKNFDLSSLRHILSVGEPLNPEVVRTFFYHHWDIFTKLKHEPPTKFGESSRVSNSLIANGCEIHGEVENCIIFRGVKIKKGAIVKNSIIMQKTQIEEDVMIDNIITDKQVTITKNAVIIGTSCPKVIKKRETV